jgi:hypothetical protein
MNYPVSTSIPAEALPKDQRKPEWQQPSIKKISLDITLANGGSGPDGNQQDQPA